ncbi:hypothetical protein ACP70R_011560 [Stipagrostis hirtigluma subsp. patula]
MASLSLKRKRPSGYGAVMGSASRSYGPPVGVFDLYRPEPSLRDRRKRRKDKLSWVEHTFTPYFDGHSWRKYGEKIIKDSPFHRCSYREDKKCMASKQVQQENFNDPPLFCVTYEHEHTCNAAPVPAPDVMVVEDKLLASDKMMLRFGSSSGQHQYARMQQEWQQYHQPVPLISPFLMTNIDSSGGQLHEQQPAFPSDVPPAATSWLPSFPIIESLPMAAASIDEGGMFSTLVWDSFRYCSDDHLHLDNNDAQLPGNSSRSLFSWETDGCSLAHMLMGIETECMI